MSAQPQHVSAERRLSGERAAVPPPEPPKPVWHIVSVAVLLATLLGVGLLHWTLVRRFGAQTETRAARAAMIGTRALADLAAAHDAEGEGLRAAVAEWQEEHPSVRTVRVVNIAGTERDDEVKVERQPDGALLVAAPVEKDGAVIGFAQVLGSPEVVPVKAPRVWFAIAFALAPFVIVLALSFVIPSRAVLIAIAAAMLVAAIFAYRQWAVGSLVTGAHEAEQRFAERVRHEARIVARIAPGAEANAGSWDADRKRRPLRIDPAKAAAEEHDAIDRASYGIGALSLALLFFVSLSVPPRLPAARHHTRAGHAPPDRRA